MAVPAASGTSSECAHRKALVPTLTLGRLLVWEDPELGARVGLRRAVGRRRWRPTPRGMETLEVEPLKQRLASALQAAQNAVEEKQAWEAKACSLEAQRSALATGVAMLEQQLAATSNRGKLTDGETSG